MIPTVRKRARKETEIAIVNLVDVIFILLIFFIMTTTFSKETGIDITKPAAGSAGAAREGEHPHRHRQGGRRIHLGERQVDMAMLQTALRKELAEDADKAVVIVVRPRRGHGRGGGRDGRMQPRRRPQGLRGREPGRPIWSKDRQ